MVSRSIVFEFQYSRGTGDDFSWDQLIHCGDTLLEQIIAKAAEHSVN